MLDDITVHEILFYLISGLGVTIAGIAGLWLWLFLENREAHKTLTSTLVKIRAGVTKEHHSLMEKMHNMHVDIVKSLGTKEDRK
jgi:hypothetical protein